MSNTYRFNIGNHLYEMKDDGFLYIDDVCYPQSEENDPLYALANECYMMFIRLRKVGD